MPLRRRELRPGTAKRYEWIIRNYIAPVVGDLQLTSLRAEHLIVCTPTWSTVGAANGGPLASKTVYDVHVVIRSALRHATRCRLVDHNVAIDAHPPRPTTRLRPSPEIWSTEQLAQFLDRTTHLRLHPALHLAATTGMRRGELAGLRWADWQPATHRLSIARSRQSVGGRAVEIPTKTAASRRCIDLDATTEHILRVWRQRQRRDRLPAEPATRSSPTRSANRSTPNRSPNSSTAKSPGSGCRGSASTTCATPTPHCSSPPEHRSRSCPNASATPTPASRWPPTSTCSPAWAPPPPATSPPSSPPPAGRSSTDQPSRHPRSQTRPSATR